MILKYLDHKINQFNEKNPKSNPKEQTVSAVIIYNSKAIAALSVDCE